MSNMYIYLLTNVFIARGRGSWGADHLRGSAPPRDPADYPANPGPAAARLLEASSAAAKAASGGDASG